MELTTEYNISSELASSVDLVGKITAIGDVILGFNVTYKTELIYYILPISLISHKYYLDHLDKQEYST